MNIKHKLDSLKGADIALNGEMVTVRSWYLAEGQAHIVTPKKTIKIDKSLVEEWVDKIRGEKTNGKPPTNGQLKSGDYRAGEYFKTTDYDKFVFHKKNRNVNKAHVSELVSSIAKNDLLFAVPILVNERFEIIDGQHRLSAAMQLKRPIFYIIQNGLTIDDAIDLNINTKNWGYGDYMEHWISQGNEHYVYYKKYRQRYGTSYTQTLNLLHFGSAANQNGSKQIFERGEMKVNHRDKAEFIGRITLLCSRHGSFSNDRSFIRALDMTIENGRLDPFLFLKKVSMTPDRFHKCSDTESYLRMMEDVINYHNRGDRIRLF
jgi:hypothetical protein